MEGILYAMGAHHLVTRGPLQEEQIIRWFTTCNLFIRWNFFRRLHELSSLINLASHLPLQYESFRKWCSSFEERIWLSFKWVSFTRSTILGGSFFVALLVWVCTSSLNFGNRFVNIVIWMHSNASCTYSERTMVIYCIFAMSMSIVVIVKEYLVSSLFW